MSRPRFHSRPYRLPALPWWRLLIAGWLLLATAAPAGAWELAADGAVVFTVDDTHEAIEAVEPAYRAWVKRIVACETGGTFNPYARGDHGKSHGVAQVHTDHQAAHYYRHYTDRDNPYEAVEYLWRALRGDFAADRIGWWRWSCR